MSKIKKPSVKASTEIYQLLMDIELSESVYKEFFMKVLDDGQVPDESLTNVMKQALIQGALQTIQDTLEVDVFEAINANIDDAIDRLKKLQINFMGASVPRKTWHTRMLEIVDELGLGVVPFVCYVTEQDLWLVSKEQIFHKGKTVLDEKDEVCFRTYCWNFIGSVVRMFGGKK